MNMTDYEVSAKFPMKNDYFTFNIYKEGKVLDVDLSREEAVSKYGQDFRKKYLFDTSFKEAEYNLAKQVFQTESNYKHNKFREDLFKYYGVENNPKKELLFNISWEHGHSEGLYSVKNWLI